MSVLGGLPHAIAGEAPRAATFTVTEITRLVKRALQEDPELQAASRAWIAGEVSNFKRHTSGHLYFTLKDPGAALRAVMFRSRAQFLQFEPENGMAVLARGSIGVYERDGTYQLYVDELQPHGVGALHLAFEQLKRRLAAEGLFDAARKRPLPLLPRRVGVVTSPTGAAIRDIISVSLRRFPNARLVLAPVLVQGAEAPEQIAAALDLLARVEGVDVIICGRGGGSLEELWAFNDERVARAIHRCAVPVISAVGHETDFTIADFVADVRAPTPSAAAELAWPDKAQLRGQIAGLLNRLQLGLRRRAAVDRQRLQALLRSPALTRPTDAIAQLRQRVDDCGQGLVRAMRLRLREMAARRDAAVARLNALSPLAVLQRGYSLTTLWPSGPVVHSYRQAPPGQLVQVRLAEGELLCAVQHAAPPPAPHGEV